MNLQLGGGETTTLANVLAPGKGRAWLVVGTQSSRAGTTQATTWTSPGALNWEKTVLPSPPDPTPAAHVSTAANAASYWGGRAVVVGSIGTGPTMKAAVWISNGPGRPFSLVPDSPALDPPSGSLSGAVMDTVTAGALGVFAAGTVAGRTTLWYSTDGEHWSVLSGAGSIVNRDPGAVINDLLITPSGVFAAGSSVNIDRTSAALWYSSDGIHWTTVRSAAATFFGSGDHLITSLVDIGESGNAVPGTPGPTGILAVGGVRAGAQWQPASWISPNGFSWSQTSLSFTLDAEPLASAGAIAYAATGANGRLLAVGGSRARQRLWESGDGLSWTEIPLPAAAQSARDWHLGLVAASDGTTVVADNLPGQPYLLVRKAGVWHQPSASGVFGNPLATAVPTSLVSDNGTLVMSVQLTNPGRSLGAGTTSVAVLTSLDGVSWQMANVDAFDQARVSQLLAVKGGVLAVGWRALRRATGPPGTSPRQAGSDLTTTEASPAGAFASISSDLGTTWPSAGIGPAGPGELGTSAVAVGRIGAAEYIAGNAGTRAMYWFSPNGTTWQEPQPLDQAPQLGVERPEATCFGTGAAVVVGSVTQTARGSLPAAWVSNNGSNWANAALATSPPAGSTSIMDWCVYTGNSFIASGGSTGSGAALQPAMWSSPDGASWQQSSSSSSFSPFTASPTFSTTTASSTSSTGPGPSGSLNSSAPSGSPGSSAQGGAGSGIQSGPGGLGGSAPGPAGPFGIEGAPLGDIATGTTTWVGVSGQGDLPSQRWPAPVGGAAGALPVPVGLWTSNDAGTTWQQLDPLVAAFEGALYTQATAAVYVGQGPVVAGTLDGQLAVWVGTPSA